MSATKKRNIGARIYPAHKPKKGDWVLWWDDDDDTWNLTPGKDLEDNEIWLPQPQPPSPRLRARAQKQARG